MSDVRFGRSVGAVLAGFVVVAGLSLATDQVLHVLRVYPPWGEPMPLAWAGGALRLRRGAPTR